MEWSGSDGVLRYYDKATKQNVDVGNNFTFIVLDQLASIMGWNDASESGIYSNEVKDTRSQPLTVKAFKGGVLAEGLYANIRNRIKDAGGHFTACLYVAFKNDGQLVMGCVQLKGAALSDWMDFSKEHGKEVFQKAVAIIGAKEGKKGSIKFKTPIFTLKEITPETNDAATDLDRKLQTHLTAYLARNSANAPSPAPVTEEAPVDLPEQEWEAATLPEDPF